MACAKFLKSFITRGDKRSNDIKIKSDFKSLEPKSGSIHKIKIAL